MYNMNPQQQQGGFGFDVSQYEAQAPIENLPVGWYNVQITESDLEALQSGKGTACKNVYTVFGGPYNGRKVFDNLNIIHESQEAQDIARRQLRTISDSIGKQVQGPWDLVNCYMCVKVGLSKPSKNASDAEKAAFEPRNDVKGYKPFDQQLHTQNSQPAAQQYTVAVQPGMPMGNGVPNYAPQSQPQYQQQAPQQMPQQAPQQQMPQQQQMPGQGMPSQPMPQQMQQQAPQQMPQQMAPQQQYAPQPNNAPQPGNEPGSQPGYPNGGQGQAMNAPDATGQAGQPSQPQAGPNAQQQTAPQQTFAPQPGQGQGPQPQNIPNPPQNQQQLAPNPQYAPNQQQMPQPPQQQAGNTPQPPKNW